MQREKKALTHYFLSQFHGFDSCVVLCKNIIVTLHICEEQIPIASIELLWKKKRKIKQVMPKQNTLISEFETNKQRK